MKKLFVLLFLFLPFSCPVVAHSEEHQPQYKLIFNDSQATISDLKLKMISLKKDSTELKNQLISIQKELKLSQERALLVLTSSRQTISGLEISYQDSLNSYKMEISILENRLWWANVKLYACFSLCLILILVVVKKSLII